MVFTNIPRALTRVGLSAVVGLGLLASTAVPLNAAPAALRGQDPDLKTTQIQEQALSPAMLAAQGNLAVYVKFKGQGAYEQTQPRAVLQNRQAPVNAQAQVQAIASRVQSQAQSVASASNAQVLYTTHNVMPGVALRGDAQAIRELASRQDVERITPIVPKYPQNAGSVVDTGAAENWARQNTGYTGEGVKIAVIDSGIDYTHADFGGPGTKEAFEQATKLTEMPNADSGLYDPQKFLGGYDLAGDDYDGYTTPTPDANPIDCISGGHGTHVAGTAAGWGVSSDGKTFRGDYSKLSAEQLREMKIGPGAAPQAQLYSFRVFGCTGSTNLVIDALDRTLDPNGDGDFSDRAQIVNLSLGGEFSPEDDPDTYAVEAMSRQGVLAVVSAGNASGYNGVGDTYSNSGQPANAVSALTVANSVGSSFATDAMQVLAPEQITGKLPGDYSSDYNYAGASEEALTGDVVAASDSNKFGCEAFSAEDAARMKDKWVFLEWAHEDGTFPCGSKARFDHAEAAGAKGVVLSSQLEHAEIGIAGNDTIPGFRVAKSVSDQVREAAKAGTLKVRLGEDLKGSLRVSSGAWDELTSSSARGYHGSYGYTKPDLAAPGNNISSAFVGTGNGSVSYTGTSMSAPFASGVAAQVLQAHQDYSPQRIKAALMNSANHDLHTADGHVYAVDRVGSGRVDAKAAVDTRVLVYNAERPEQVSQSFGVLEYAADSGQQSQVREMTVENFDSKAHTYTISYAGSTDMPGVEFSMPSSITVQPGEKKNFQVKVTIDPAALEKTMDPAMEKTQSSVDPNSGQTVIPEQARQFIASESGRIMLTEGEQTLRVPLHAAPKPTSAMKVTGSTLEIPTGASQTRVPLEGTELNQGGYRSLLGAFEWGASAEKINPTNLWLNSNTKASLQHVGASSNAPALKDAGKDPNDGVLSFGTSTWRTWDVVSEENPFTVNIDTDGNNRADYVLKTDRGAGLDIPIVRLMGYKNGSLEPIAYYPLNGAWGDTDTNMMDTNTLIMSVPLKDLGLTEQNAQQIRYSVEATTQYEWETVSQTDWISYSPFAPKVWFSGTESSIPGIFADAPSTDLTVHRSDEAGSAKALFLHLHNGTGNLSGTNGAGGDRAQVMPVVQQSTEAPATPRFTDVSQGDQFYTEIAWLAQRRITTGYPDGSFRPTENTSRAAMAAYFYRLAGSPQFTAPSTPTFKDVAPNHQFYREIEWFAAQGITTGYADGTFRPDAPVNRDAMAAFFYRYAGSPQYTAPSSPTFRDVTPGSQFYREIEWLADQKITTGWADHTYRPLEPIHRDAMAAFIYRYSHGVIKAEG